MLGGLGGAGLSDATIGGVNLSDMVDGRGQWRNISPAVRAALRALFNTVLAQGEKISDLQKVVAGKPDFDYVRVGASCTRQSTLEKLTRLLFVCIWCLGLAVPG